jgi:hypothetical protein
MDGRWWIILFLIMLYGVAVVYSIKQYKKLTHAREQVLWQKMEHKRSHILARQKNYHGQVANQLRDFLQKEIDPHVRHKFLVTHNGKHDFSVYDPKGDNVEKIVRVRIDLLGEHPLAVINVWTYDGLSIDFADCQESIDAALLVMKLHICKYVERVLRTHILYQYRPPQRIR